MVRTNHILGALLGGVLASSPVCAAERAARTPPPPAKVAAPGKTAPPPKEVLPPPKSEDEATPASANPYQGIIDRNVFHLNPPPVIPDPEATKPPPPKIFLTGISTLRNQRRALLKTAPIAAKPGEAPKEQSYVLSEHEAKDGIEVLAIDEIAGSVKLRYEGEVTTINFKDNSVATVAAAPGPPAHGVPGQPPRLMPGAPGMPPMPAANPLPGQPVPGGTFIPGAFRPQFPQRPVREAGTSQ